jgi:hypothetical protein
MSKNIVDPVDFPADFPVRFRNLRFDAMEQSI